MGTMERINSTPLPYIYVLHLRIFLILYLVNLPLILVEPWGWMTILITAIISWALMGVEAASCECERPFKRRDNHLHLERFCDVVTKDICELLEADVAECKEVRGSQRLILTQPHL